MLHDADVGENGVRAGRADPLSHQGGRVGVAGQARGGPDPVHFAARNVCECAAGRLGHQLGGFLAVAGDGTEARCRRLDDLGHVAHADRRTAAFGDHDAADVRHIAHQTQTAHQVLLAAQIDGLPADLLVVGRQRFHHLLERQLVLDECVRVDLHLELADAPAEDSPPSS